MDHEAFRESVEHFRALLEQTDEATVGTRPSADAWSLKEIVGHLIDSASNNHQRFVRLQIGLLEGFPAYEAEQWVHIQQYGTMEWNLLKALWLEYNRLILAIVQRIARNSMDSSWSVDGEQHTLEWLVNDYYRHLRWHTEHYRQRSAEVAE